MNFFDTIILNYIFIVMGRKVSPYNYESESLVVLLEYMFIDRVASVPYVKKDIRYDFFLIIIII